jgi:hypothetical protein
MQRPSPLPDIFREGTPDQHRTSSQGSPPPQQFSEPPPGTATPPQNKKDATPGDSNQRRANQPRASADSIFDATARPIGAKPPALTPPSTLVTRSENEKKRTHENVDSSDDTRVTPATSSVRHVQGKCSVDLTLGLKAPGFTQPLSL